MEKIAVVAPIPNASISTAVRANPRDLRSCRRTKRRSKRRFCMETSETRRRTEHGAILSPKGTLAIGPQFQRDKTKCMRGLFHWTCEDETPCSKMNTAPQNKYTPI